MKFIDSLLFVVALLLSLAIYRSNDLNGLNVAIALMVSLTIIYILDKNKIKLGKNITSTTQAFGIYGLTLVIVIITH